MKIRVMLVDDHEMVRRGLALMLQTFEDFDLVGEATNGAQAVELCVQVKPDVVLMDLVMPIMDGVQATRLIRQKHPETRILTLTSFSDQERIEEALKAGALGYLLKDTSIEQLAHAIRAAHAGKASLSPDAANTVISMATQPTMGHNLTTREREVLTLMAAGLSNLQIAERLSVGRATIKSHVSNLLKKLGVASRTEAVVLAFKHKLIPKDSPPPSGG